MTTQGEDRTGKPAAELEPAADGQQVHDLLSEIHDLEQFRRSQLTLRKLGGYLKTALTTAEALSAVECLGPHLWPDATGAVYLLHASDNILERAAMWGDPALNQQTIDWQDCWALRNLRPHCVRNSDGGIVCRHVSRQGSALPSICMPLIAHGQMLGLLHLQRLKSVSNRLRDEQSADSDLALAAEVAQDLGLAHANVRLRESLREQTLRDALTGLFNRRFVDEFLVRELARAERKTRQLSMIALDIDHFKRINDSFGHGAGDIVLQRVGAILQAHVRDSDVASRVGGEEFLLLLAESTLPHAVKRAEEIRSAIHDMSFQYDNQDLGRITASFGAVAFPDHGRTAEALIRAADKALYAAKTAGRNQVVSAKPPMH